MPSRNKDYKYWLYDYEYPDSEDFLTYVLNLQQGSKKPINVLLVTCDNSLMEELTDWQPENFKVNVKGRNEIFTINISKLVENNDGIKISERVIKVQARIVKYKDMPIYIVFSDSNKSDFKMAITKLMHKHYPIVSRLFLKNKEMEKIFDSLEEQTGNVVFVEFSHGKKRLSGMNKNISQMTYTNEPYAVVFEKIFNADQWLESIRFEARIVKNELDEQISYPKYSGIISRGCFFSAVMSLKPFLDIIIPSAIKFAYERNEYLQIRSNKIANKQAEPIVIRFDDKIFSDISQNRNFVDSVTDLEHISVSSFHTNPYIHISLLDYLDGSSYDFWIVSEDRLIIYPQISASTASMNRIVNHIFERIGEGDVEDYGKIKIA